MAEKIYRGLVLLGLAIIIILLALRGACSCGADPWTLFPQAEDARIGQVSDNDPRAP